MIIPLRTDYTARRRPVITESLVLLNLLIYLIGLAGQYGGLFDMNTFLGVGRFDPQQFNALNLISYQFLHDPGSIFHIIFNLIFLWVFGCAVEDRLGRVGFLCFYLLGGAIAGLAHGIVSGAPVIGASGAVSGVSGAFLALFPRSRTKILLIFFIIGIYAIPSMWLIGFFFLIDLLSQFNAWLGGGDRGVAYAAHIAGSLYGFFLCFFLLAIGRLPKGEFDIFHLFKQSRRRAAFRSANKQASGGGTWTTPAKASDSTPKRIRAGSRSKPASPQQNEIDAAKASIAKHLASYETEAAATEYAELLDEFPGAVLTETRQIDVANQLYKAGDAPHAAAAYELFLDIYPASTRAAEISLLLGVLYARKLDRSDRARELIDNARSRLTDPDQKALAAQLAAELAEPTP